MPAREMSSACSHRWARATVVGRTGIRRNLAPRDPPMRDASGRPAQGVAVKSVARSAGSIRALARRSARCWASKPLTSVR